MSQKMDRQDQTKHLTQVTAALLKEKYRRDPVAWLREAVKTNKQRREEGEAAIQPFPMKPYIEPIVREWQANRIMHIVKSRQMSMSWLCQAMLLWEAQFGEYRLCVVINKKKEDAEDGVARIKLMYQNQPEWLKNLCPLDRKMRDMPRECLTFENGSKIQALAQGADQIRGLVPATALLDEAVFQDELESTYGACVPCCSRIVTVSSAGPGYFQRLCTE